MKPPARVLFILLLASVAQAADDSYIVKVSQKMNGTGCVVGQCKRGKTNGVIILTCAHIVHKEGWVDVHWNEGKTKSKGWVVAHDVKKDLAIIRVEDVWPAYNAPGFVKFEEHLPEPGTKIILNGIRETKNIRRKAAVVGELSFTSTTDGMTRNMIMADDFSTFGDSGAPITAGEKIVGIVASNNQDDGNCCFIHHKTIHEFFKENEHVMRDNK